MSTDSNEEQKSLPLSDVDVQKLFEQVVKEKEKEKKKPSSAAYLSQKDLETLADLERMCPSIPEPIIPVEGFGAMYISEEQADLITESCRKVKEQRQLEFKRDYGNQVVKQTTIGPDWYHFRISNSSNIRDEMELIVDMLVKMYGYFLIQSYKSDDECDAWFIPNQARENQTFDDFREHVLTLAAFYNIEIDIISLESHCRTRQECFDSLHANRVGQMLDRIKRLQSVVKMDDEAPIPNTCPAHVKRQCELNNDRNKT